MDSIWSYDQSKVNTVENNTDTTLRLGLPYSGQSYSRNNQTITPNDIIPSRPYINAIGSFDQLSQRPVVQHGLGSVGCTQQPLPLLPRGFLNLYPPGFNVPMQNAGVGQAMHRATHIQPGWPGVHHGWGFVQQHQHQHQDRQLVRPKHQQMLPRGHFHRYPPHCNMSVPSVPGLTGASPFQIDVRTVAGALANAIPEQRRIMLGELLYPRIEQLIPDAAAKVTSMLLEIDHREILFLLESPNALSSKVAEAMVLLREVNQRQKDNLADQLAFVSLNDQD